MSSVRCIKNAASMFRTKDSIMAEQYFKILAQNMSVPIVESNSFQDRTEKWDYEIVHEGNNFKVDVKCMKRISRTDTNPQDNFFWIELDRIKTNTNSIGWLYAGKADIIAFECAEDFVLVKKSNLRTIIEKLVDKNAIVHEPKDAVNKIYLRKRPKKKFDTLTLLKAQDVRKIAYCKWEKTYLMKPIYQDACEHITGIGTETNTGLVLNCLNKLKRKRDSFEPEDVQFKYCPKCGAKFC